MLPFGAFGAAQLCFALVMLCPCVTFFIVVGMIARCSVIYIRFNRGSSRLPVTRALPAGNARVTLWGLFLAPL